MMRTSTERGEDAGEQPVSSARMKEWRGSRLAEDETVEHIVADVGGGGPARRASRLKHDKA